MILNDNNYPTLYDDGSVEYLSETQLNWLGNFDDNNYWLITIRYYIKPTVGSIYKDYDPHVPDDILDKIKHDGTTYLLLFALEPVDTVVEDIYRYISSHDIPPKKVVLISEIIDINLIVDRVSTEYNLGKIKSKWASVDEYYTYYNMRFNPEIFDNVTSLAHKRYTKTYLNFNRRWRAHRTLFVSLLYCTNLLDKGFVSLGETNEGNDNWSVGFDIAYEQANDDQKKLLSEHKTEILTLPNLYIDTPDLVSNRYGLIESEENYMLYQNSYFSVVSETCFFQNVGRFLTEKTFKPMAFKHPFIMLTRPNTWEFLRQLGYQSFHPYIDESYDLVEDNATRLQMVLDETSRLSNMTQDELYIFIEGVKPILEHNFNVLKNKKPQTDIIDLG